MKQTNEITRATASANTQQSRKDTPCIEMEDVTVRFDGKTVLEKFSLMVDRGEKVVLTGPSGRGKSTVLRSILGFVVPESGTIRVLGEPLSSGAIWRLRTLIGYVPQEPDLGSGSVRDWLERPFSYRANKELKKNLAKLPEMFHQFLLPLDLLEKDVETLSGGEKQRVTIVSTLLLQRPILLLDEPTSALDEASRKRLTEFLSLSSDLTVLMVSHEPELLRAADRKIKLS